MNFVAAEVRRRTRFGSQATASLRRRLRVRGSRRKLFRGILSSIAALIGLGLIAAPRTAAQPRVLSDSFREGEFALVHDGVAAPVVFAAPEDFKVVAIAANDFAADVERVTGIKPVVRTNAAGLSGPAVLIGTLGHSPIIDRLAAAGKLDAAALRGKWESFIITAVSEPLPGVPAAVVVAGSDRRGTAYGVYELSQTIGVSPWHWWADVAPETKTNLFIEIRTRQFGPPSVQYRGIFLNDEDWGLQPWAAKTFAPEDGDIGPKTYRKIFELLLRLKANTLWPAMHACTKPFNSFAENARLADDYAIVMGSSHAEPMLRNNVGEWIAPPESYNYATNRDGVRAYWEKRVRENGRFENIYTIGMRGVHDSAMQGARTPPEQIKLLDRIFADQRAMLSNHVNPRVELVPQMFCAYKEVLDLYRRGLKVPDDVTIVWPDDNFGYIREFASPEEQQRSGGFGIYYHVSYLGRPLSYLWLETTPPALIQEEMTRAYDLGARKIWIVNVGDLKPAEIGIEFFLQLAWDIRRWQRGTLPDFLVEWATREFGAEHAREIAAVMNAYYRLNFQRKPEHLQWWLPNQPPRPSDLTPGEAQARLEAFTELLLKAGDLQSQMPESKQDAFYELVTYPVRGSALANRRFFYAEESARQPANSPGALVARTRARAADAQLKSETRYYNQHLAGGKWNRLLALEPADTQWRSMRLAPFAPPADNPTNELAVPIPIPASLTNAPAVTNANPRSWQFIETNGVVSIAAEHFTAKTDRNGAGWEIIPGLGRTGDSVAVFPATARNLDAAKFANAPRLDYAVRFSTAGEFPVTACLLPTHPVAGRGLRFAVGIDDRPPQLVVAEVRDGSAEWAQGVLNAAVTATARINVSAPGTHTLRLYGVDAGVVLDKIVVDCGGLKPGYLGPHETAAAD